VKVGKVMRVEPKTIGIAAVTCNRYTTSRMALSWQSDLFLIIFFFCKTQNENIHSKKYTQKYQARNIGSWKYWVIL